jgi:hypothetical protein
MNSDEILKDKIYSRFTNVNNHSQPPQAVDAGEDSDATAETRSAPGDLAKLPLEDICIPGPSGENDSIATPDTNNAEGSSIASSTPRRVNQSLPQTAQQKRGHLRGTRSNGFASGPPFPTKVKQRETPWTTIDERQKQQQIELIEKELSGLVKESQCGIKNWRPKWMQRFSTKQWMLFLLCWFCTIQGMLINGLVPSSLTTIERRFELSTSTLGRVMQFYDFGYVLFCIPVSYFGGRHSKPVVLGIGLILMALGSFLFSMPHLLADSYTTTYNNDDDGLSQCYGMLQSYKRKYVIKS